MNTVDWVVFDLGETLVDESANWQRWADFLGLPHATFSVAITDAIAAGRQHTEVFAQFRPDVAFEALQREKAAAGFPWNITDNDLYPDALPTLQHLRAKGYRLAVMANQPIEALPFMQTLPVDLVATSAEWGLVKPEPAFFQRVVATVGAEPGRIAYVGDRVDNDVLPAKAAGMLAVHLRRGPWGRIHADWPDVDHAHVRLDDLTGLAAALDCL